jgi:hypothetical protein
MGGSSADVGDGGEDNNVVLRGDWEKMALDGGEEERGNDPVAADKDEDDEHFMERRMRMMTTNIWSGDNTWNTTPDPLALRDDNEYRIR